MNNEKPLKGAAVRRLVDLATYLDKVHVCSICGDRVLTYDGSEVTLLVIGWEDGEPHCKAAKTFCDDCFSKRTEISIGGGTRLPVRRVPEEELEADELEAEDARQVAEEARLLGEQKRQARGNFEKQAQEIEKRIQRLTASIEKENLSKTERERLQAALIQAKEDQAALWDALPDDDDEAQSIQTVETREPFDGNTESADLVEAGAALPDETDIRKRVGRLMDAGVIPSDLKVVAMLWSKGVEGREIARVLKISASTVSRQIERLRNLPLHRS